VLLLLLLNEATGQHWSQLVTATCEREAWITVVCLMIDDFMTDPLRHGGGQRSSTKYWISHLEPKLGLLCHKKKKHFVQ
jgi:hypothetical protein